ncbi:FtsK/SpoIIIE family DNA translocase [Pseudalkalibacillus salsuginis]|uniref:FtsK/SpoIIIE family DNA translocase n=1 Tax=Pseudalkalibacillus salsuginis TaxID=2910972 RepID=UPI001F2F0152|nr:DNA translocase FtsK [Pseudalkalibacillus salsuginis]MCF6410627.1 DNA translocase FtsK [Pseudalkalibacillus salsuginis]
MAKRKKKNKKSSGWKSQLSFEVFGLLLFAMTLIAAAEFGKVGNLFAGLFRLFGGEWYGILLLGVFVLSIYIIWKRAWPRFFTRRLSGVYLFVLGLMLQSHVKLFDLLSRNGEWENPSVIQNTWELFLRQQGADAGTYDLGGGMIGAFGFAFTYVLFAPEGTQVIIFFMWVIAVLLITGLSMNDILAKVVAPLKKFILNTYSDWKDHIQSRKEQKEEERKKERKTRGKRTTKDKNETKPVEEFEEQPYSEPIIEDFTENTYQEAFEFEELKQKELQRKNTEKENQKTSKAKEEKVSETGEVATGFSIAEVENESYELPPYDLLSRPVKSGQHRERQHVSENTRKLERTFESFGVKAKVVKVHLGPAVTKYEVQPAIGVKVSKIVNLTDDLALALAAKDLRIEAPIPGRSAIGIEVPNQEVSMVSLREVVDTKRNDLNAKLSIGLGRDISGEPILADLSKMPHLLIAGATGSGKSVCVNGIITSILMKAKPHEVKMMMIDPKMVELNMYNGIPHLLAPVVTEPKKAAQALKRVVNEMERRYELFSHSGTRNIEGYNNMIKRQNEDSDAKQALLPYIVVIVDELADLMMVASGDVEDAITRLAQMARAAGIHLIIATQRPSVDVITGVIKANIPSRIAFSVSSSTDSRTILDMGGAEKLLGKGDMLFFPIGANKPTRVQGAFLSDEEVQQVVDFVIGQQKAKYQEEMIPTDEPDQKVEEVEDELFDDAVNLIVDMQTASVSMLQRRFRIGYTRAARLIDAMEARGIVGPYEGSKPREVLISTIDQDASSS